jgi:hypothetical protein
MDGHVLPGPMWVNSSSSNAVTGLIRARWTPFSKSLMPIRKIANLGNAERALVRLLKVRIEDTVYERRFSLNRSGMAALFFNTDLSSWPCTSLPAVQRRSASEALRHPADVHFTRNRARCIQPSLQNNIVKVQPVQLEYRLTQPVNWKSCP